PIAAVVDALRSVGLPPTNEVVTEIHGASTTVQSVNTTMQSLAPDLHKMANMAEPLRDLAASLKGFTPQKMDDLTKALKGVTETGEKLLAKFK
ncbi:MAG: hypothetical protein Q8O40_09490, partial [Chloroflexota bacterium]|nr:hypothetical protein [Chloroflexota bacterium]